MSLSPYQIDSSKVREISLGRGFITLLDKVDFYKLEMFDWRAKKHEKRVYAHRVTAEGKSVQLHRQIIGAKPGEIVDHINRVTLDNRRENLRIVSPTVNAINRSLSFSNKTGVTGVHYCQGMWRAVIGVQNKTVCLGTFNSFEAAIAIRRAAENLYYAPLLRGEMMDPTVLKSLTKTPTKKVRITPRKVPKQKLNEIALIESFA